MLNPAILSSPTAHLRPKFAPSDASAICIRVLKFVSPVDFSDAYKAHLRRAPGYWSLSPSPPSSVSYAASLSADPDASPTLQPWIRERALLPAADAEPSAGLLQPFREEGALRAQCRYLEYLWYWRMPAGASGRARWERAAVGSVGGADEGGSGGGASEVGGEESARESDGGGGNESAVRKLGHLNNVTLALRGLRTMPEGTWDF